MKTDSSGDYTLFTVEDIRKQGLQKRNKPILTADTLKPCFYRTFEEFENNDPGFTYINDKALLKLLKLMHYQVGRKISKEAPDTSYWGFATRKKILIRCGYDFYELQRKDGDFYLGPTLDALRRDENRAVWNLLFGLTTLTTGIATKQRVTFEGFGMIPPPEIPMVVLQTEQGPALGLQLDWDTGKIIY